MRTLLVAGLVALSVLPALAGGFNVNYLVPAFVACPGPDACGTPERESGFTFESATLRSARGRYLDPKKPSLAVELKGVKDASGAPVTSNGFTVRVSTGQVNLPSSNLTLPPGHLLSTVAPIPIPLKNGNGSVSYKNAAQAPPGTVVEGGSVTLYDSDGKRLATVGTQAK